MVLNKLRQFQDLGHTVIFLIGDFTSMIGDPSGRNTTRPPLTREQIEENAKTYFNPGKLARCLEDRDSLTQVVRCMGTRGVIQLSSRWTVARMLDAMTSTKPYQSGVPISIRISVSPHAGVTARSR